MASSKDSMQSKIAEMQVRLKGDPVSSEVVKQRTFECSQLISECSQLLEQLDQLGRWEAAELKQADRALQSRFLRLALIYASKAIDVSELPNEEYEAGYSYTQSGPTKAFTP